MNHSSCLSAALLAAVLGTMGCQSSVDVHAVQLPTANFEKYRTFAIAAATQPPGGYSVSSQSYEAQTEIRDSVAQGLLARGYTMVDENKADLVVRIEEGRREEQVSVPALAAPASNTGSTEYQAQIEQKEENVFKGAFTIDVLDGSTRALVWQGAAHAEVTPGHVDHGRLRHAVESVLQSFPRR